MMMREVTAILSAWEIDFDSISINTDSDLEFSTCDISGERANVYPCTALTHAGETVQFEASEELVGGHLGSIAGCF